MDIHFTAITHTAVSFTNLTGMTPEAAKKLKEISLHMAKEHENNPATSLGIMYVGRSSGCK
jgi:hypothetical protein